MGFQVDYWTLHEHVDKLKIFHEHVDKLRTYVVENALSSFDKVP